MYVKKAIDIPLLTPRCKLPSSLDFRWPTETTEPLRKNNKQDSFSLTDFIYPLLAYVSTLQRTGRRIFLNISYNIQ